LGKVAIDKRLNSQNIVSYRMRSTLGKGRSMANDILCRNHLQWCSKLQVATRHLRLVHKCHPEKSQPDTTEKLRYGNSQTRAMFNVTEHHGRMSAVFNIRENTFKTRFAIILKSFVQPIPVKIKPRLINDVEEVHFEVRSFQIKWPGWADRSE